MIDEKLVYSIEQTGLIVLVVSIALLSSVHAVIFKRNTRSAFAWLGVIFLSPLFSALMYLAAGWLGVLVIAPLIASMLYIVIGINSVPRKFRKGKFRRLEQGFTPASREAYEEIMSQDKWSAIIKTGESLGYSPAKHCQIELLNTGDEAYPAMISAINQAKKTITLFSYIFNVDAAGNDFIDALVAAKKRGIRIRVLVDAVGSHRYASKLLSRLSKEDIPCETFLPVRLRTRFSNMRNHRKLMVVDAKTAFTGGLNIAGIYWPEKAGADTVTDLHFKLEGGIVNYLQEVFVNDWYFVTGETLKLKPWYDESGNQYEQMKSFGRVIVDGPSFEEERIKWHFLNAINSAKKSIRILTPYFLPDEAITAALSSAALRGVNVEILVPNRSDSRLIDWALRGSIFEMLARGCKIYLSGPNFDHSKLLIIDNDYISIGSANWDARSLRLNFELNVEIYSEELSAQLIALYRDKKSAAKLLTLDALNQRNSLVQVRDGIARLFGPYL